MLTIIGIGSPMPGDQLGWQVIDQLQQLRQHRDIELDTYGSLQPANQIQSIDQIQLIKLDRPGSGLLDYLDLENRAILIDAIMSEQHDFGEVIRLDAHQLVAPSDSAVTRKQPSLLSSHGFGLREALLLASQLKRLPPECQIIGLNLYPSLQSSGNHIAYNSLHKTPAEREAFLSIDIRPLIARVTAEINSAEALRSV